MRRGDKRRKREIRGFDEFSRQKGVTTYGFAVRTPHTYTGHIDSNLAFHAAPCCSGAKGLGLYVGADHDTFKVVVAVVPCGEEFHPGRMW